MSIDFQRTTLRYVPENPGTVIFGIILKNVYLGSCDIYKKTSKAGIYNLKIKKELLHYTCIKFHFGFTLSKRH